MQETRSAVKAGFRTITMTTAIAMIAPEMFSN